MQLAIYVFVFGFGLGLGLLKVFRAARFTPCTASSEGEHDHSIHLLGYKCIPCPSKALLTPRDNGRITSDYAENLLTK
jgi:hypothetical protein